MVQKLGMRIQTMVCRHDETKTTVFQQWSWQVKERERALALVSRACGGGRRACACLCWWLGSERAERGTRSCKPDWGYGSRGGSWRGGGIGSIGGKAH
eukprot:318440-Rhodomonas_salina.2